MAMKYRQLKKLCKKVADLSPREFTLEESDYGKPVHGFWFNCGADEFDFEDAWSDAKERFLVGHTDFSKSGMKYIGPKSTTRNILSWAKAQ